MGVSSVLIAISEMLMTIFITFNHNHNS